MDLALRKTVVYRNLVPPVFRLKSRIRYLHGFSGSSNENTEIGIKATNISLKVIEKKETVPNFWAHIGRNLVHSKIAKQASEKVAGFLEIFF